jgi:hypothetical protein
MGNCGIFTIENGVCAQTPVVGHIKPHHNIDKHEKYCNYNRLPFTNNIMY